MHAHIQETLSSSKKVLAQVTTLPYMIINNYQLKVVDQFTYLGSTISSKLSLNKEIDRQIGRAATTHATLPWNTCVHKSRLTIKTKVQVHNVFVLSTLLYGSKSQAAFRYSHTQEAAWDILDQQDTKHSCSVQMWTTNYVHDTSSKQTVLAETCHTNERRKNPHIYFIQRAHCWRAQSWISPILLSGWDMKELNIDVNKREEIAMHLFKWRSYLQANTKVGRTKINTFENKSSLQKKKN